MEYDIREFEILHELEGETKIFEDKYPTYFLVILCEKDIMFLVDIQENYFLNLINQNL